MALVCQRRSSFLLFGLGWAIVFEFGLSANLGITLTIIKFSFIEAYEYSSREPVL